MPVIARVDSTGIHVRLTGWASVFGFARRVDVRLEHIVDVRRAEWADVRAQFGRRLGSAYLPGGWSGGWFLITKGRQHLVWCWLERGKPAVLVRTNRFRPGQVAIAASLVEVGEGADWFTQRAN